MAQAANTMQNATEKGSLRVVRELSAFPLWIPTEHAVFLDLITPPLHLVGLWIKSLCIPIQENRWRSETKAFGRSTPSCGACLAEL